MRVLVTGGAGFIGSHLVERLVEDGHHVRVLDNLSSGRRENLAAVFDRVDLMIGDIRDRGDVAYALRDREAVVHLAAVASVPASMADPAGTHETNFEGTLKLLDAARRSPVRRFLYASSAAIYGDSAALPLREEVAPMPLSPYAADKLAGEFYLRFYTERFGLSTTAFRFFNIYGPRQDPSSPYSGVISRFLSAVMAGQPVRLFGDGRQTRDFVYVADVVEVLVAALSAMVPEFFAVNIGTGREQSLLSLVENLEQVLGRPIGRQHEPRREGDIVRSCADVTRLKRLFGFGCSTTLQTGLGCLAGAELAALGLVDSGRETRAVAFDEIALPAQKIEHG
ncbi:MAG TPA: NAD-dependent epimerase/dehydratase family protein [Acidiferrobacteraceae bacterium]|nr:NAD-dependent epimerase/dehydratase family protein [Acidiferrobacteraceae bacterium]